MLPDTLVSGTKLRSPGGTVFEVRKTKGTDAYGAPKYKLVYAHGVISSSTKTRDELQELGCEVLE